MMKSGVDFENGDLRVRRHAPGLEAHLAELAHQRLERDPVWSAIEIAVANEFIIPRRVEPSMPISVRKISPTDPSSYTPTVM
jgi:hypothetical protein